MPGSHFQVVNQPGLAKAGGTQNDQALGLDQVDDLVAELRAYQGELESQMPMLKKQNLHHTDYAKKSFQELVTKEQQEKSITRQVNYSTSCIAFNSGNSNFSVQALPAPLQLSSVKAILPADINNDGYLDLIMGGNEFGFQPQLGRLDANEGTVLLNDGKGSFVMLSNEQSGIRLQGQVRDIVLIKQKNGAGILFLRNNEFPELYRAIKK